MFLVVSGRLRIQLPDNEEVVRFTARPLLSWSMPALVIAAAAAVSLQVARGDDRLCPAVVPPPADCLGTAPNDVVILVGWVLIVLFAVAVLTVGASVSSQHRGRPLAALLASLAGVAVVTPLAALLSRRSTGAEAATVVTGDVFCVIIAFVALVPRRKLLGRLRGRGRMS
jgi:hypothetical protein